MRYATWNLRNTENGYLDGPESTIVEQGGYAQAIWANGQVENGATILGKVDGDLNNVSEWNFIEISKTDAETFIANNFTPYVDEFNNEITLEKVFTILN